MNIDWDGKGLPPVGVEVEHQCFGCAGWTKATVIAYGAKKTFYSDGHGREWSRLSDEIKFRPIPDEKWIAEEKRKGAINEMVDHLKRWNSVQELCGMLYDAGYRKFEIVEGDV